MKERIEARLRCMVWLESESINYSKKDFKKDIDRIINAIHEAEFVDIITIPQADELKALVVKYTMKYM